MKKIELQKIKAFAKTHTPAILTGAAIGGATAFVVTKAFYIPNDKDTLYLTDTSLEALRNGEAVSFNLNDAMLILFAQEKE